MDKRAEYGQRHYALPHVFCFIFLAPEVCGLHLRILLHTDSYHSMFCYILCGIRVLVSTYTVPSFNISLLSPYCYDVKFGDEDDEKSYTPPRNGQVHEVRSLNTGGRV